MTVVATRFFSQWLYEVWKLRGRELVGEDPIVGTLKKIYTYIYIEDMFLNIYTASIFWIHICVDLFIHIYIVFYLYT